MATKRTPIKTRSRTGLESTPPGTPRTIRANRSDAHQDGLPVDPLANLENFLDPNQNSATQNTELYRADINQEYLSVGERMRGERERYERVSRSLFPAPDPMAEELQSLRNLLYRQQQQIDELRASPERRVDVDAGMLNRLVRGIQTVRLEVNAPKFEDECTMNPQEFITELEKYFLVTRVEEGYKMSVVEGALDGRAKIWYRALRNVVNTYPRFKAAFLAEFYSIPIRVRIKSQWLSSPYTVQSGSLQTYFFKQITEAQYFDPPLDPLEINYTIIQQLPTQVQNSLISIDYTSMDAISGALSKLDAIANERERLKRNNPTNTSYSSNNRGFQPPNNRSHTNPTFEPGLAPNTTNRRPYLNSSSSHSAPLSRPNNSQISVDEGTRSFPPFNSPPPSLPQISNDNSHESDLN